MFRPIQMQYKCIDVIFELYSYSGRIIPLNANTIQYKCNLTVVKTAVCRPSVVYIDLFFIKIISTFTTIECVIVDRARRHNTSA